MRKLHDIFLQKFLLLFITIFITLGIISYVWIKDIYIEQTKIGLLNNIDIFSLQIKNFNNIDKKVNSLKQLIGHRITIINKDGIVIAESHKDKVMMDNHKNRSEIVASKYQEYGALVRYSTTLKKELLYVSKRYYINDNIFYIRMARDIEQITKQFFDLSIKIGVLFLIFMIIAFWISLKISNKVQEETNEILEFLQNLTKQTKALKIESNYSLEFYKITDILTKLSQKLATKNKQKSKYTAKLKLSNRQKDDIISAISHEFKNPIAVISGYTQTLQEDKDINPNIRDKFLEKISSNVSKLTNMIDRLRLSIKLEEGNQLSTFTKCNLKSMVENIIDDLKQTYQSRDIKLKGKNIVVNADETMLNVAITNLIENALKYSQDSVVVELSSNKLSVIDSGVGLKSSEIGKITDKFYRVSSNGWNNSLGVGLALVKSILDLHKFKLKINSVENEGSKFSIVF